MDFSPEVERIGKLVDFTPLHNKSVLITGATGFVGNWMLLALKAAEKQGVKFSVTGLDKYGYAEWLKCVNCFHYDYIVHLAPDWNESLSQCITFTQPEKVLFASSGAVYHPHPNEYGKMKITAENELLASGVDVRIARMFTFCGPYLRWPYFAIGNFVHDAWEGIPIKVLGDGTTIRSYMYGADLAVWLWSILLYGNENSIYDIGSEEPISMIELARTVRDIVNPQAHIAVMNAMEERAPVYLPKTQRTREELGLKETYSLDEQITRFAEWMYEVK